MNRARKGRLRGRTGPLKALAGIGALDLAREARDWSIPVSGLLDEPAHLLTAAVLLAASPTRPAPRLATWALAGSIAIDVDHVPLYLGHMPTTTEGGRPVTHSLSTVALLAAAAGLARGRARTALAGLATGVVLHFVRDLASWPGVPLFWPAHRVNVQVPYAAYAAVLGAAAATAVSRGNRIRYLE